MQPIQGQKVGQYGYPGNFNLSGSGIAMVRFSKTLKKSESFRINFRNLKKTESSEKISLNFPYFKNPKIFK
jgi:hypothetical protein